MPRSPESSTTSIIVGICLGLLAAAILVGYSVLARHSLAPEGTGVAATAPKGSGRSITIGKPSPAPTAPPRPDRPNDHVLGKRIHRSTAAHVSQPSSPPAPPRDRNDRVFDEPHRRRHHGTDGGPRAARHRSTDGRHRDARHRDHVPNGNAWGYWSNGQHGDDTAASSHPTTPHGMSSPPGHSKTTQHGHAYGRSKAPGHTR
ncbi:MAG TPA: hypothetical protein VFK89_04175 [Actinomycetota bacterium]|nr:hypothetical protein [Actinomycetota bacterium]